MTAWGIYARVSDPRQTEGQSIEAQLSQLRTWAAAHGYATREFVDAGVSAWTDEIDKRPQFKAMLQAVERGEVVGMAASHVDRMARDEYVLITTRRLCDKQGAGFVTLDNPSSDPLLTSLFGVMAKRYSDELSQKIKRGWQKRAELGLHVGELPFGYCNGVCKDCKLVKDTKPCERWETIKHHEPMILHPTDSHGVLFAFTEYARGIHSFVTVADALNESGYRTRTGRGRELWSKYGIDYLLGNKVYLGLVVLHGQEFEGRHTAIISPELYEQVQAIRQQHNQSPRSHAPKFRIYVLSGILVCAACGQNMQSTTLDGYSYHRCLTNHKKKMRCEAPSHWINAAKLEAQLGAFISRIRLPADWRDLIQQLVNEQHPESDAGHQRKRLERELKKLNARLKVDEIEPDDYTRAVQRPKAALAAIEPPKPRAMLDAGALLESLAVVWQDATPEERKAIVGTLFERVTCDTAKRRIVSVTPKKDFAFLFAQIDGLTLCAQGYGVV